MLGFDLRISQKLPLIIITSSLLMALILGFTSYFQSSSALQVEVQNKLQTALQGRRSSLEEYLKSIQEDLRITAANPMVRFAIEDFRLGWLDLDGNPTEELQKLYIEDNPFPTGEKEKLDAADDWSEYSIAHKKYHIWFRKMLQERAYYDIFLFDRDGNLVYTVFKELDYATNLTTGKWKDTDLGNAFRSAKGNPTTDFQAFFDFKPYAPSYDAPASFISSPILDADGEFVGVLAFQMPIDRINHIMQDTVGMGRSGESYIVGSDFLMRSDSRFSDETTILKRSVKTEQVKQALDGQVDVIQSVDYRDIKVEAAFGAIDFLGTRWAVISEIDLEEFDEPIIAMRNTIMALSVGLLIVIGAIGIISSRSIAVAIVKMTETMTSLADGDNSVDIPSQDRADEIGEMSNAVKVFKDNAVEREELQKAAVIAEETARDNSRRELEDKEKHEAEERAREQKAIAEKEEHSETVSQMIDAFEEKVGALLQTLGQASDTLQSTATDMASSAESSEQLSATVASASNEASASVQNVASAAEQLSASITEISKQVTQASDVSEKAVVEATNSIKTVKELSNTSKKISEVVDMINDIAGQTNLLALNATIEAARAGDAGKGFAVVASEVKALANQTAKATEEISNQIGEMQRATDSSVNAMNTIDGIIQKIRESNVTISSAVEEQSAATNEISRNVQEASSGTTDVSQNIILVSEKSREAGVASAEVLSSSQNLELVASTLKHDIEIFLDEVKSV
ncbi:hypothetical protein A9Q83_08620 [Alphaproteobacteria bacterium 46_93_T64]|nr:hypothetical protein A9Q83_08620 [Alphaproteobacteria bacterium 46_93_T64]